MTTDLQKFADREQAAAALAATIETDLRKALQASGSATLIVSGGSSPLRLYERLSAIELDWRQVWVVASDERVVPEDHADSNAGMIRRQLLKARAQAARLVSLLPDAAGELAAVADRINALPMPAAHVVLGMGGDGHTASLFPTAAGIDATLDSDETLVLQDVPGMPSARISLTVRTLLDARAVSLLVFGADKLEVLQRALAPGSHAELPVRAILHQNRCPVTIYWAP